MSHTPQHYCISTVAINQKPLDFAANTQRICQAICELSQQADKDKCLLPDLVVFPELCISGYGCEDAFHFTRTWQRSFTCAQEIARYAAKVLPQSVIVVGLPFYDESRGRLYNANAVLANAKIYGLVPKSILANNGVHYEPRWFYGFHSRSCTTLCKQGESFAFGLAAFSHKGVRFIIENCRDAWGPRRPAELLNQTNFDIILNPSASHFAFDKYKIRRNIVIESSRRFGVAFALTNLLGCEAGRLIYDGHMALASCGVLQHESISFSFRDFVSATFPIDISLNRLKRLSANTQKTPASNPRKLIHIDSQQKSPKIENIDMSRHYTVCKETQSPRNQQFLQAACLGLFDYLRKSGTRSFFISLSGGVDSAICAVLVQRTLAYAIQELGACAALERLGHEELLAHLTKSKNQPLNEILVQLMPRFLYTLYQSTKYSSQNSRKAAAQLSKALGACHSEVDIQEQVDSYVSVAESILEKNLGRKFDKTKDGLALQNIQARSRAPLAWLLANASNSILLSTSNRSEAAVGYCTMDGDTAGGLAPLASVEKSFLRDWLLFMQKEGDALLGPIPELSLVNQLEPSAELVANQRDELDLMPYSLLDQMVRLSVSERKGPQEILEILVTNTSFSREELGEHLKRFYDLFAKNQWKRERLAPCFHLAEESLDPRGCFRFPIFSEDSQAIFP